ncbi:MAG: phosphoglucosamine mutase [Lachnospiraceae bacterium]|nr:phosphoglucosamine mutase [Lachnospiraceae bacterium]
MKYFGTDGFRGRVNDVLRLEHAIKIGEYLGHYYKGVNPNAKIVIGKDTRKSSYMFEYALSAGIVSMGADVYLMHVTTTPCVSYITKKNGFDCGIMITASHNPFHDNGIKIIDSNGDKMKDDFLQEVEDYIDGKITVDCPLDTGKCYDYLFGRNEYVKHLIDIPTESFKGYKIGLDCANGASFSVASNIFNLLGADVFVINNQPDGENINVKCGSTCPEILQDYVVKNGLDVGFAFDGDADRCMMVDEQGKLVDGDGIIYVISKYLKLHSKLNKDTVVATVMSNIGLTKSLKLQGINIVQTDVGDKYVAEAMFDNGYAVGGEQSGHIILGDYATTGDGILTALMLTNILVSSKAVASSLTAGLEIFPQQLVNVSVPDKDAVMKDEELLKSLDECNKELDGSGRVLLRKSGTEPLIRIMVEAETEEKCAEIIDKYKKYVEEHFVS